MSFGNVVIIEDDFFIAEEISDVVSSYGFEVISIISNYEDVNSFKSNKPINIVFSDIDLNTEKNGIDCCKLLANANKNINFVFITSYYDNLTIAMASELNYLGYIPKPYEERDIFIILETYKNRLLNRAIIQKSTDDVFIIDCDFFLIQKIRSYIKTMKLSA